MRKEKKLNPVKKLAKKTALRTAYQAQAHAKQAGQEIRGGASGEGPSDNYAQQKVEDKAKEAAEDAAGFAFRSTKIPYKMYRRLFFLNMSRTKRKRKLVEWLESCQENQVNVLDEKIPLLSFAVDFVTAYEYQKARGIKIHPGLWKDMRVDIFLVKKEN